jgi:dihydrodipicolinate synthase/N-acetylneuraminate lyase
MDVFTGVAAALVTLLDRGWGVDNSATAALAGDPVGRGMRGMLVCGITGEVTALSDDERLPLSASVCAA